MQGFLIGLPQRLFDSDGAPADGWKIYFTHAGLGTSLTTYSDAGLTSQNTDPVVCDSSGYYRAFVAEAVIADIEVKNASGVSQFTLLSVEAMPDTSGSSPSVTAVPTGGILAWSTGTAPTGFLLCNGAAVSRATYSDLNTLLSGATPSYPYGNGDGATTFNVPNLVGRFPLYVAASGTGSTLGGSGGAIDHTHTGPSHTHTVTLPSQTHTHTMTVAAHTHTVSVSPNTWGANTNAPSVSQRIVVGDGATTYTQATTSQTDTSSSDGAISTSTGATDPFNGAACNVGAGGTGNTSTANPPYLAVYYIIKT